MKQAPNLSDIKVAESPRIKLARALHLLAYPTYPTFVAAILHGLWLGHGGIDPTYMLGNIAVGGALGVRLFTVARHRAVIKATSQ